MELTIHERAAIHGIAERLEEPSRTRLREDLAVAVVASVNVDRSIIAFDLPGYDRPTYRGQHPVLVEGVLKDGDGADVEVLLHVDENERLLELELVKYGDGPLVGPQWAGLEYR